MGLLPCALSRLLPTAPRPLPDFFAPPRPLPDRSPTAARIPVPRVTHLLHNASMVWYSTRLWRVAPQSARFALAAEDGQKHAERCSTWDSRALWCFCTLLNSNSYADMILLMYVAGYRDYCGKRNRSRNRNWRKCRWRRTVCWCCAWQA